MPTIFNDIAPPDSLIFWIIGATALTTGFPNGVGVIWLDDLRCTSRETRLIDCPASPIGTHNCGHIEDAGVRCTGTRKLL